MKSGVILASAVVLMGLGAIPDPALAAVASVVLQDPSAIQSAVNQGQRLMQQGRPAEAIPLFQRAATDAHSLWGDDSPDAASLTLLWADAVEATGRWPEAEIVYRRALALIQAVNQPGHPVMGLVQNNLGLNLVEQGRYPEALTQLDGALAIRRATEGETGQGTLISLSNRAVALKRMGRFLEADAVYRQVLAAREATLAPDDPVLAITLNNLAVNLLVLERASEAEPILRRVVAIREATLGPHDALTVQALGMLADSLASQGRIEAAEAMQRRVLASFGTDAAPLDRAGAIGGLANILLSQGKLEEAQTLTRQALEITRAQLGSDHPETASAMVSAADVLILRAQSAQAQPLLIDALRIDTARLGAGHPGLLRPLFLLAVAEGELGDTEGPIQRLIQARDIAERSLPSGHIDRIGASANLGSALAAARRPAEALPILRQAGQELAAKSGARLGSEAQGRQDLDAYRYLYRLTVTSAWDRSSGLR